MNLGDARIILRPRGLTDVLDLALRACVTLYRRAFVQLTLVLLVPALIGCVLLHRWLGLTWVAVWLLSMPLAVVLQGPFTIAASQLLFSDEVRLVDVLARAARRLPAHLLTLFVARALPLATIVLSPIILQRPYVHEAVLLEGAGPGRAWTRAAQLVQKRSGTNLVLGCLLVLAWPLAAFYAHSLTSQLLEFFFQISLPKEWIADGQSPFFMLGTLASVPYVACARFLGYIDMRTRLEGWDLQLRFAALGQAAEERRAA
jgi:hypothetical protein